MAVTPERLREIELLFLATPHEVSRALVPEAAEIVSTGLNCEQSKKRFGSSLLGCR